MSGDTFVCVWCACEKSFPGARFGDIGWACSGDCYGAFMDAYWRVQEPDKHGQATKDQHTHVQDALRRAQAEKVLE